MGRPFTASDEQVLQAAAKVLLRRGPDGFSVAEVASEVGIGRAAIILRFKSTHALKMILLTQFVEQFAVHIGALPKLGGGDGLLQLAAFIGSYVRSRENGARFFARFSANLEDPDLTKLETRRGDILRKAISQTMPKVAIGHEAAVTAFLAHLTGSILAWISLEQSDSRGYLVARTREWLKLASIPFSDKVAQQLVEGSPATADASEPIIASARSTTATRSKNRRGRSAR